MRKLLLCQTAAMPTYNPTAHKTNTPLFGNFVDLFQYCLESSNTNYSAWGLAVYVCRISNTNINLDAFFRRLKQKRVESGRRVYYLLE
jgi:hypothetical protein